MVASSWRLQPRTQREIQSDLDEIDSKISIALGQRIIATGDADALHGQAARLRRSFALMSRDGLDRDEVLQLEESVNEVRMRLKLEARRWDQSR